MALRFRLVTPDRVVSDEEVLSVSLPTPDGEITVLPHHIPLASLLAPGIIRIKRQGGEEEVASAGGFINVTQEGVVTVLADTAERGQDLDLTTIEEAKKRAQDVMQKAASQDDVSFAAAAAGLERELARYKVAFKHRRRDIREKP